MCSLENMFIPEAVIKVAVNPKERTNTEKLSKALLRFRKEDPTFRVETDEETGETLISGMGELHLEVYAERIRREYGIDIEVGAPRVSYREQPTVAANFDYKHKKQSGGSGQFAHIKGELLPFDEDALEEEEKEAVKDSFIFEESIVSGRIPKQFIPAVEKGLRQQVLKGVLAEYPVVGLKCHLMDGSYHDVDSSEMAFQTAARGMFRENMPKTKPILLEPVMRVEIEVPEAFQGPVVGDLTGRRGIMESTDVKADGNVTILCEVPLSETFGYATDLRSMTQGQGTFSMEVNGYRQVPKNVQTEIIETRRKEREERRK